MKFLISVALLFFVSACQTSQVAHSPTTPISPVVAMDNERRSPAKDQAEAVNPADESFPPVELGEKWGPQNVEQTDKIVTLFEDLLKSEMKPGSIVKRDAHPKHHACVTANLKIDNTKLPAALRVGLYSSNSKYDAWIRFSNGAPDGDAKNDIDLDQRGMAVKILGVPTSPTGNQDLLMMDDERFFSKDGENYLPMTQALLAGGLKMAEFLVTHPHQAQVLLSSRHRRANLLSTQFFSSVPYKLGPQSSRFTMSPCKSNDLFPSLPNKKVAAKNFLRNRLVATLAKQDSCFDLSLQPNNDPKTNDVEDPTQVWDAKKSPFIVVGRLVIPQQKGLTSSEQMNFCENVSMDPWRAPAANRPLGQINRIRKLAYPRISGFRHHENMRAQLEPRSLTPCEGETADLCQSRQ
jgi:hypothetical protein